MPPIHGGGHTAFTRCRAPISRRRACCCTHAVPSADFASRRAARPGSGNLPRVPDVIEAVSPLWQEDRLT
jgi:hypothetical protein